MTIVAAVLAAGRGARFGGDPKQHALLGGRPVVLHSVEAFAAHPDVDEVWVVGPSDGLDRLRDDLGDVVVRTVVGGATRTDSVENLVSALHDDVDRLLVHDAARPLVPAAVVDRVLAALETHDAVATVVPISDAIVEVDGAAVVGHPDREVLRALQTPQGFRVATLRRAFETLAGADPTPAYTDDVTMVGRVLPDAVVTSVEGDVRLHKVTRPVDLLVVEALLADG